MWHRSEIEERRTKYTQTGIGNCLYGTWINSLLSSLSILETDYKCDDYGRDSGDRKHCSESACENCNDEEMSEMSSKEYPVRVKKIRERRVENYRHQRQKIMANAISWWRCLCCFTGTKERDEPASNYTVIPFLSIMPCINNLFLLLLFMIF